MAKLTITFKATDWEKKAIAFLVMRGDYRSGGEVLRAALRGICFRTSMFPPKIREGLEHSVHSRSAIWRHNGDTSGPLFEESPAVAEAPAVAELPAVAEPLDQKVKVTKKKVAKKKVAKKKKAVKQ